jgi:hypothetical protein
VNDPLVHLSRLQGLIEAQRGLVPVEHRPLHAPAVALARDTRQPPQQRPANAMGTLRGTHEQVFEVQARATHKSREVEEKQGETCRLALPLGDQHVDDRMRRFQLAAQVFGARLGLVCQFFVLGKLAHQRGDDGRIGHRGGSDVQHGHYSAMNQRMSLSRSSTKRL